MRPALAVLAILVVTVAAARLAATTPGGAAPTGAPVQARTSPVLAGLQGAGTTEVTFLGLTGEVPTEWTSEEPDSSMRLLQMAVPGAPEHPEAEMVVYYFGPGQGGSVEANVDRWRSQFAGPEGGPVEPEISRFEASGMPVTVVELTGTYTRGVGTGAAGPARSEQTLVAAVLESDRGSLFIQLHGPRATVALHREVFADFLRSLRRVEPSGPPSGDRG